MTPAGSQPAPAPPVTGPRGSEPEAATPPRPDAAPQQEATGPAVTTEAPAAAAAPDAKAEPPPTEPAAEEAAAMAEAAAPEAAEVPEVAAPEATEVPEAATPEVAEVASTTPLAQEEEPEVVLGRRLLPCPTEVPLPRLFAKSEQAQEELHRLGDRIKTVSARYARERAELVLGRELLQEQLQQALDREAAADQRERAAVRREKHALERERAAEKRVQAAADREKIALKLANQAKVVVEVTKAQEATLAELEAAAAERERRLAAREAEEVMGTPPSLGAVLPALDSTAEQLRHMEAAIFNLLETEGRAVARGMAEYILTCLRSHDPSCALTPILVGPVPATAAAAQESVQEAADMVALCVTGYLAFAS
ncbi:atherin-like [Panicum hallii]|uniref:atherin-like n=1 Tax=Panicum hallii TaxID=206008 RepID=UPI000DF4E534|nr:atherin-like [Panicum hallii]